MHFITDNLYKLKEKSKLFGLRLRVNIDNIAEPFHLTKFFFFLLKFISCVGVTP
jgi:hypothetical protein